MLPYKEAKFHITKKEWYIDYYIMHPETGKWHRFKKGKKLSVMSMSITARLQQAGRLVKSINRKLGKGLINPWPELAETKSIKKTRVPFESGGASVVDNFNDLKVIANRLEYLQSLFEEIEKILRSQNRI